MRTLCFLQLFFRRMFMSFPRKRRRATADSKESFLAVLRQFKPFVQLDTKIARARAQDEPVLYEHVLPGLDVLLCTVRGAQPRVLCRKTMELVADLTLVLAAALLGGFAAHRIGQPLIVGYIFIQRYLVNGVVGAVKG